jgi:hypothetical protein
MRYTTVRILQNLKKKKISVRLSVGALARMLRVHSESGNPSFCNSPKASPNFATLFVLWPVAGTFGYSFDRWRRMTSSTKHTTVIRKGGNVFTRKMFYAMLIKHIM